MTGLPRAKYNGAVSNRGREMAYDEKTAARVRKLFVGKRGVNEKSMMGGLSFMVGGNMVCSVSGRGGMLIRVAEAILPYLISATNVVTAICIVHFLPLSISRATRTVSIYGFFIASYLFGLCVWMYGFLVTMSCGEG